MVFSDFYFVKFNMKDPVGCNSLVPFTPHPTWCQHSLINYLVLFFSLTNTASTASSPASQNAARLHTLPSSVSIIQTTPATAVTSTVANKVASTLQQSARSTPSPAGSASGNAAATAKKVIDIVDLSDEEEDQPKYEIFIIFTRKNWNFVTKIVLMTYCEKKLFYWLRKTFEIRGWRLRICKNFEITRTIYSNSKRSCQNNFW